MKAIQKELGELKMKCLMNLKQLAKKIEKAGMPKEAKEKCTDRIK